MLRPPQGIQIRHVSMICVIRQCDTSPSMNLIQPMHTSRALQSGSENVAIHHSTKDMTLGCVSSPFGMTR